MGVWGWAPGATAPTSHYLAGNEVAQVSGNLSMLNVASLAQFAEWAQRLADGSTYIEQWGVVHAPVGCSLPEVLARARS